jgi:hypothetical protein
MAKKVQISVTYLFEYDEETLRERFDDLDTEEEFERAARIMLFGENMNEYEPNDIEIEVIN